MRCCLMLLMFLPSLLLAQPILELGTGVNQASSQSSHPESNSNSAVLAVDSTPGYVARIDLNKPGQITEALRRAEEHFQSKDYFDSLNSPAGPIAFVILVPTWRCFSNKTTACTNQRLIWLRDFLPLVLLILESVRLVQRPLVSIETICCRLFRRWILVRLS